LVKEKNRTSHLLRSWYVWRSMSTSHQINLLVSTKCLIPQKNFRLKLSSGGEDNDNAAINLVRPSRPNVPPDIPADSMHQLAQRHI